MATNKKQAKKERLVKPSTGHSPPIMGKGGPMVDKTKYKRIDRGCWNNDLTELRDEENDDDCNTSKVDDL